MKTATGMKSHTILDVIGNTPLVEVTRLNPNPDVRILAMSESVSEERQKILRARGAEIVLTPGHLGTDGAIDEVTRLVSEHPERYYRSNQYSSPANWMAHYNGTAVEIWE